MNNENINKIKSLDEYFPKGDKRRGEALVLVAEAFLLGKEVSHKTSKEKIPKEKRGWGRSYGYASQKTSKETKK